MGDWEGMAVKTTMNKGKRTGVNEEEALVIIAVNGGSFG